MLPSVFNVEDKTVIITGAARGIGKGIAQVLAEAGAKVLVTALTDRYLIPLSQEMEADGHPIDILPADATNAQDWERTVSLVLDKWGHIDVLVNCLGDAIRKPLVPLPGSSEGNPISDEEYRFVIDVNLTEAFMGCRAVGPHMLKRGQGKVINISSFSAAKGTPEMLIYATAKAGLVRFTQTLALEWAAYGVTVNCIAPGNFPDREHGNPADFAARQAWAKGAVPLGRVGDVREVGYLALYLASEAANYMTGETIYLDGGLNFA